MKDLDFKISSKICEWMKVEISFIVKFFKLYPRGREALTVGAISESLDLSYRNQQPRFA